MKKNNEYDVLVDDKGPKAVKITAWTVEEALLGGFHYAVSKYPQATFGTYPPIDVDIYNGGNLVGRGVQIHICQTGCVN